MLFCSMSLRLADLQKNSALQDEYLQGVCGFWRTPAPTLLTYQQFGKIRIDFDFSLLKGFTWNIPKPIWILIMFSLFTQNIVYPP